MASKASSSASQTQTLSSTSDQRVSLTLAFLKALGMDRHVPQIFDTNGIYSNLFGSFLKVDDIKRGRISCTIAIKPPIAVSPFFHSSFILSCYALFAPTTQIGKKKARACKLLIIQSLNQVLHKMLYILELQHCFCVLQLRKLEPKFSRLCFFIFYEMGMWKLLIICKIYNNFWTNDFIFLSNLTSWCYFQIIMLLLLMQSIN